MDVADVAAGDQRVVALVETADCVLVGPAGGLAVGFGLQPLPQFVGAARDDAVLEQQLDLTFAQGIALDRGRVMGLLDPNVGPDVTENGRLGQAPDNAEIGPRLVERLVDLVATGAAPAHSLYSVAFEKD